jgi:hypothetical protein
VLYNAGKRHSAGKKSSFALSLCLYKMALKDDDIFDILAFIAFMLLELVAL